MTIERRAVIKAPLPKVYKLLADDRRLTEWRDDLVAIERVSPPGPLDGAKYRETLRTPLGHQSATVQLNTEENKRFAFKVLDGPLRPQGSLEMSAADGGTEVVYTVRLKPLMGIPTPLDIAAGAFLTGSVERSMNKLKSILEGEA
jgi:hypothetical protein